MKTVSKNSSSITTFDPILFRELPTPVSTEEHQVKLDTIVRFIVAQHANGNISLQQAKYITDSDMEKLRAENQKHVFVK